MLRLKVKHTNRLQRFMPGLGFMVMGSFEEFK